MPRDAGGTGPDAVWRTIGRVHEARPSGAVLSAPDRPAATARVRTPHAAWQAALTGGSDIPWTGGGNQP